MGSHTLVLNPILSGFLCLFILCFPSASSAEKTKTHYEGMSERCYEVLHGENRANKGAEKLECLKEFQALQGSITIVVSASRHEEELREASAPVALRSQKELVRISSHSVADYLRDIPGIEVTDAGQAGQKRIRLRGEEARRTLLLIDGQEFTDQREVGTPLLIAPEMIERIEVVRGANSVLYGSKAIGGVVNIITKKGGYHPFQASASHLYDSSTDGHQSFGSIYGSVDWFDYRLSVGKSDHGLRDTPLGEIENTGFEWDTISAYLGGTFDNHTIGLSYDTFESSSEVFVEESVRTSPPFVDFAVDIPQRDREKFSFSYTGKNLSQSLAKLRLDAYLQQSDRVFHTFSDTFFNFGFPLSNQTSIETDSELSNIGTTLQTDWDLHEDHFVIAGYQFVHDDVEQDRVRSVVTNGASLPSEFVYEEASRVMHSFYVQDKWEFLPDWMMTVGGRAFFFDAELDETTRDSFSPGTNSNEDVVGSIGVSYLGLEHTTIWGRWAQGYLFPTLNQTSTGAFAGVDFVNPNSQLQPERSHTFDVGFRYDNGALSTDLSIFTTLAEDYIDFVRCSESSFDCFEEGGRSPRVYINADRAKTFGAEVGVRYSGTFVEPYGSAAWIRRKLSREDLSTYDSGLPALSARVGVRRDVQLASALSGWVDTYLRLASESHERDGVGEAGLVRKSGWGTLNISAGLEIGSKKEMRIVADVLNIFDKAYTPARENLVAPGTAALVRFVVDL